MLMTILNPFITKGYVSPHYFCDRAEETGKLISTVLNGNNVVLMSPRRMGKTGLICHSQSRQLATSSGSQFYRHYHQVTLLSLHYSHEFLFYEHDQQCAGYTCPSPYNHTYF